MTKFAIGILFLLFIFPFCTFIIAQCFVFVNRFFKTFSVFLCIFITDSSTAGRPAADQMLLAKKRTLFQASSELISLNQRECIYYYTLFSHISNRLFRYSSLQHGMTGSAPIPSIAVFTILFNSHYSIVFADAVVGFILHGTFRLIASVSFNRFNIAIL